MSIFAIGNGKVNGELGTGNFEEKLDPVMLETIKGKTIVELKACESNAVAITGMSISFLYHVARILISTFSSGMATERPSLKLKILHHAILFDLPIDFVTQH
jgi:hypothetical protein